MIVKSVYFLFVPNTLWDKVKQCVSKITFHCQENLHNNKTVKRETQCLAL